jgi:hypothetical protein
LAEQEGFAEHVALMTASLDRGVAVEAELFADPEVNDDDLVALALLDVESVAEATLVRAEPSLRERSEGPPSFPPKLTASLSTMSTEVSWEPVWVLVAAEGTAGEKMLSLLSDDYGATGEREGDSWKLTIRPIDQFRRGTIIYRVIQASRMLAARHPETTIYLITEDGNRWRLPPSALEAN